MRQNEGYFTGTGNTKLYWRCWLPDSQPKAIIVAVHGLGEHISRYTNLVNNVVPRGYAVYGLDHFGHGKSEGTRVFVPRFQVYLDDLKTFYDIVKKDNPSLKIFLLGHSMGGLIATAYTVEHQKDLAGLIVSAPAVIPGESITSSTITLAKVLSAIAPRFGVQALDSSTLSHDKAVVEAYDKDPLVYRGKITARLGSELFSAMSKLGQLMPTITLPILIMQGSEDRLVNHEGSKLLYAKVGSQDKTLKIYDAFYHEIFNEPDRAKVFADLDAWLESHT